MNNHTPEHNNNHEKKKQMKTASHTEISGVDDRTKKEIYSQFNLNVDKSSSEDSKILSELLTTVNDTFDSLPTPDNIESDLQWKEDLVRFVCKIAIEREKSCKPVYRNDIVPALKATGKIINEVVMFISEKIHWSENDLCMPELMEKTASYIDRVNSACHSTKKSWFGFGNSEKSEIPIQSAANLFYEFTVVLEQCFNVLGNRYHNLDLKLQWINECGVFLTEIRNDFAWANELKQ